jgi:signal transduction histidine kinase
MASTSRELAILDLIVHELRTPLSVAAGSLPQMSAGPAPLAQPQQAAADRVSRALDHLNMLVDQLRTWRRTADSPNSAVVQLAPALAKAFRSTDAGTRGVTLALVSDPGADIQVMSAGDHFIPALASLVAAVVRSAPNRSTVRVEVVVEPREVRIAIGDLADAPDSEFPAEFIGGLGFSMPMAKMGLERAGGRVWSRTVDGRILGIGLVVPRA